jgi:hypothetical protein
MNCLNSTPLTLQGRCSNGMFCTEERADTFLGKCPRPCELRAVGVCLRDYLPNIMSTALLMRRSRFAVPLTTRCRRVSFTSTQRRSASVRSPEKQSKRSLLQRACNDCVSSPSNHMKPWTVPWTEGRHGTATTLRPCWVRLSVHSWVLCVYLQVAVVRRSNLFP